MEYLFGTCLERRYEAAKGSRIRPNFHYVPQSQRDYFNQDQGIHGLQFKGWDYVGDRFDDLKGYSQYTRPIHDIMRYMRTEVPGSKWVSIGSHIFWTTPPSINLPISSEQPSNPIAFDCAKSP